MKKKSLLLILGIISLIYFSCSDENNSTTEDATAVKFASRGGSGLDESEVRDAKSLFSAMALTAEYGDFVTSINNFKVKLLGNDVEAISKTEWMDWIGRNISSTSFSSISEFESMYDDATDKLQVVSRQNPALFNYLNRANGGQFPTITIIPGVTYPVTTDSCIENCMNIHSAGVDAARSNYDSAMAIANIGIDEELGPYVNTGTEIAIWIIQKAFDNAIASLDSEYIVCANACPVN